MPITPCSWCQADTSRICPICSRPFCQDHASQEDSELCVDCGASPDQEIEKSDKLVDSEGNTHQGRQLRPVGQHYITTAGEVSRMSDEELERFYNRYALLVRQCESALDRHKITHQIISLERDERARKSRKAKYQFTPEQVASVSAQSPDKKLLILAAILKKSGMTKEKLQELIDKKRKERSQEHATSGLSDPNK